MNRKQGFTLIELLVVIAIIGILTAITYASFGTAQTQNADNKKVSDMNLIQLGLQEYYDAQSPHQYPNAIVGNKISLQALVPQYIPNSVNLSAYNYVALATSSAPDLCISYQLWTTLQENNSYLQSARDFDSAALPNGTFEKCQKLFYGTGPYSTVNPSTNSLIYDVMPQGY